MYQLRHLTRSHTNQQCQFLAAVVHKIQPFLLSDQRPRNAGFAKPAEINGLKALFTMAWSENRWKFFCRKYWCKVNARIEKK